MPVRKALVVGVNYYNHVSSLHGCVNDAKSVKSALERHGDGTRNFDVLLETAMDESSKLTRDQLKSKVELLFSGNSEVAIFYFSGHGFVDELRSGFLVTSDCKNGTDGFPMSDLLAIAFNSKVFNKVIILDCCNAGQMGNLQFVGGNSVLNEGLTILAASGRNQYAVESNGSGVFTSLMIDALNGSAANLLGEITPGSIYAHVDQSLGAFEQRPVFKTNIERFISLRKVQPPISLSGLRRITTLFSFPGEVYKLDPSFEPTSTTANSVNVEIFEALQKYNRLNLLVPVDEIHMYYAAMNSKSCKLTILGQHYWNLVDKNRI